MEDGGNTLGAKSKTFKHVMPGEHIYDDVLFFGYSPKETLDDVKTFEPREDDVFIVTYPKAGTTWMQEITWLLVNNGDIDGAKKTPVYMRSPFLEFKDVKLGEIGLDIAASAPSPRVIKSHLPVKLMPQQVMCKKRCKVIVLFRNPKDVCVSYYYFYKSSSSFGHFQGSWNEFLQMFLHGHVDHGSWFQFTDSWWPLRGNDNIKLMFYEDMKKDTFSAIKELAGFLGKDNLDDVTLDKITNHCSFGEMKGNPMTNHLDVDSINSSLSPLLRKGTVGDWKNHFTVRQDEDFDTILQDRLCEHNIPFTYVLE